METTSNAHGLMGRSEVILLIAYSYLLKEVELLLESSKSQAAP